MFAEKNSNNHFIMVTLFSKFIETLPTFKKVGEIIRIHRASIGSYKNNKSFYVNISYGSSWIIFEGMPKSKNQ
jgi:hypothetical protein